MKISPLILAFSLLPSILRAQIPPAAPVNIVSNGSFERFSARENLWDGVSSDGYLACERGTVSAISLSGVRDMAMPVSVTVGDLNGDGLPDIMTAEPLGYIRAYFNSGTKEAPVFTHAEVVPLFLEKLNIQRVPKINLFSWSGRGMPDLLVGNYDGELFFIPNQGSPSKPDFRQPADLDKATTPTFSKGLWANLLAPAAVDLNKDGLVDVLVGEGSYSANSVHLLLNSGTNSKPAFTDDARFYVAYGDGREHLTPTVADCNGDGFPDVISSDRDGKLGVYLNPGASWKPGAEFKFSRFLTLGTADSVGGLASVCAADLNGDNLFDLIVGKTNGRISVAYNRGTPTEPKFDPLVDLKGTDIWGRNNLVPLGWTFDTGYDRGNAYGSASVVTAAEDANAQPADGKACLKVSYFPSPNKVFPVPHILFPGDASADELFSDSPQRFAWRLPSNVVVLLKNLPDVNVGATYTFSMKTKGSGFNNATWTFGWKGHLQVAPDKIVRGERNSVNVEKHEENEEKKESGSISGGTAWNTITKSITIQKFRSPELSKALKANAVIEIRLTLPSQDAVLYLDDVKVTQNPS